MARPPVIYWRRENVELREVGDEAFLIDPKYGSIHHLNATGAALWRLLALPMPISEIVETFHSAFPDLTRRSHKKHLKALLEEFEEQDLINTRKTQGG